MRRASSCGKYPPDDPPQGPAAERNPWKPKPGMNRVSWDLRHESPKRVPGLFSFGALSGRKVVPGTYQVRLTAGGETRTQTVEVKSDPRLETPLSTYQAQDDFLKEVANEIAAIHQGVIRLRGVREQVQSFLDRTKDRPEIEEQGKALIEKLDALEEELIQKRTVDGQTVINFTVQLNHHFIILHGAVDGSEEGVIEGARDRFRDLMAIWSEKRAALDSLLGADLDAFNALVREKGIPAVIVP